MQKREKTKNKIITAARKLFNDKGFDHTSVDEIVENAGVAKGTFYYHFEHKNDILYLLLENDFRDFFKPIYKLLNNNEQKASKKLANFCTLLFNPSARLKSVERWFENGIFPREHQAPISKLRLSLLIPIISQIVNEGVISGEFAISNEEVIVAVLTYGIIQYIHQLYEKNEYKKQFNNIIPGIEELLNNSLNIQNKSFHLS